MKEKKVKKPHKLALWWKSKSKTDQMLMLFIGVILLCFALLIPVLAVKYSINIRIPDEELESGAGIKTTNDFYRFFSMLFYDTSIFFQDRDDIFMDWFNINFMVAKNNPYLGADSSYPPLVLKIAQLFTLMADYSRGAGIARNSMEGVYSILVFYAICLIPTYFLTLVACRRAKQPFWVSILLFLAFLVSVPFLFEYDRGNYVLLALPFTIAFFLWYNAKKKWAREIAYLCLAIAVGIKIYPAAFALILLKEKRFAGFVRTAAYSVVALVLPFAFFDGGFDNIEAFLYWLTDFSGDKGTGVNVVVYGVSYSYSPYNFYAILAGILGEGIIDLQVTQTAKLFEMLGKLTTLWFIVCILFVGLTANRTWKVLLASALATLFVPSISFAYSGLMFVAPILAFLFEKDKQTIDWVYLALFLLVLSPVDSFNVLAYYRLAFRWGVSFMHVVQLLSYMAMLGLLSAESLLFYAKKVRKLPAES